MREALLTWGAPSCGFDMRKSVAIDRHSSQEEEEEEEDDGGVGNDGPRHERDLPFPRTYPYRHQLRNRSTRLQARRYGRRKSRKCRMRTRRESSVSASPSSNADVGKAALIECPAKPSEALSPTKTYWICSFSPGAPCSAATTCAMASSVGRDEVSITTVDLAAPSPALRNRPTQRDQPRRRGCKE